MTTPPKSPQTPGAAEVSHLESSFALGDRKRADGCPGAFKLHHATDGAIGRIRFPGGHLESTDWTTLADLADTFGDGFIHLTTRGNTQIRGVTDEPGFSAAVVDRGLVPSPAHDRIRNIIVSPRAGLEAAAHELDRALLASSTCAGLAGRTLFGLDAGDGMIAEQRVDFGTFKDFLVLGGAPRARRKAPAAQVIVRAAELWQEFRGPSWRVIEAPDVADRILEVLSDRGLVEVESGSVPELPELDPVEFRRGPIGWLPEEDGTVSLGAGLKYGAISSVAARMIAVLNCRTSATPFQSVVLHGLGEDVAEKAVEALAPQGLIFDENSPWLRVTACTGLPGCAKARSHTREDAEQFVTSGAGEGLVHFSGCERLCGHPLAPYTSYEAESEGEYEVVSR